MQLPGRLESDKNRKSKYSLINYPPEVAFQIFLRHYIFIGVLSSISILYLDLDFGKRKAISPGFDKHLETDSTK